MKVPSVALSAVVNCAIVAASLTATLVAFPSAAAELPSDIMAAVSLIA